VLPGVQAVAWDYGEDEVTVDYAPRAVDAETMLSAIRELGFQPKLVAEFEKPDPAPAPSSGETAAPLPPRDAIPDWLTAKMDEAARAGRILVLDFRADWCGPCVRMEHETFTDPAVQERFERDVELVSVDVDEHPEAATAFGVEAIPHLVVVAPDGALRARTTGFQDAAAFLDLLDD